MKTIVILLILCNLTLSIYAQKRAVTENGEEVTLYDDGTWKYINADYEDKDEISTNPKSFSKSQNSTFLLKSNKVNLGFWLNPKKWSFKKASSNEAAEYELSFKNGDIYGMLIAEGFEVPLETLKTIALTNGREAAPDIYLAKQEYRNVNGLKVLFLQMNGTTQGIKFTYYGYYFSNSNGTVQFVTYVSQNHSVEFLKECEELLNGLVEL
jgi:hypothetical protein